jgi:hypothetical protein
MGTAESAGHGATDRWIDPMMSALVVVFAGMIVAAFAFGAWVLAAAGIAILVAIGPVLFVEFDETGCAVGRFARRHPHTPLADLRVDVWPGKHGGTLFARVRVADGRRLVIARAFGGPGFVARAARARGVPVREAGAGERPDVPVVELAATGIVLGSLVLIMLTNALLS